MGLHAGTINLSTVWRTFRVRSAFCLGRYRPASAARESCGFDRDRTLERIRETEMEPTKPVPELLQDSTDPDNPTAEALVSLLEGVKRIAVVGMSRSPQKAARRVTSYLASKGYEIIPVNPTADRILGRPALDCLDDIHEPVDMVLVFRPSKDAARVMEKAMGRPERPAIWLQEGILAPEVAARARSEGITVVQDLCAYKVHAAYTGEPTAITPA